VALKAKGCTTDTKQLPKYLQKPILINPSAVKKAYNNISKKEHSLLCLTGFLPCRCLAILIVSTFKVITANSENLNMCHFRKKKKG
jgi:hypothetical protein